MKVRTGDRVRVHYKGTLEDGAVFDSSEGREPLAFDVGAGQVIEGFERGVLGMQEGEERKLILPPEKAYGPRQKDQIHTISKEQIRDPRIRPGATIQTQTGQGGVFEGKVIQVGEDGVVMDLNHPLTGESLIFEVTLVGIQRDE